MHKSCIYTRLAFKTLGAFDVTFRGKGSCVLWITGLESSWCLSHFKSLRLDHMRFVLHLIKDRFLFTNLHQTTLIPRQLFSNVIRQRAVGWCLISLFLTARQEYQIRRKTSHFRQYLSKLERYSEFPILSTRCAYFNTVYRLLRNFLASQHSFQESPIPTQ